jgi:beta-lactamase class A
MDNQNSPDAQEISDESFPQTTKFSNSKIRRRRRRRRRLSNYSPSENKSLFFQEEIADDEDNKQNQKLGLLPILFWVFTITPLFFSLGIILSKTVFVNLPQESIEIDANQKSPLKEDKNLATKIPDIPEVPNTPQLPSDFKENKMISSGKNNYTLDQNKSHNDDENNTNNQPINNQRLNQIIENVIVLCKNSQLPTSKISITLIDLNSSLRVGYQNDQLRYPASVVKLFWLVMAVNKLYQQGDQTSMSNYIEKMIKQSDNDSSGYVVDWLTDSQSGDNLSSKDFQKWGQKRKSLNKFFIDQGYGELDISQKTYPLPKQKLFKPEGRELQLRGGNPEKPIRNKISTDQAASLMWAIISQPQLGYARQLLTTDLATFDWKDPNINYFNPIRSLFGESLPTNIEFVSKAGWTSQTRQEVAYIATKDGKTRYILAIFAEDSSYSKDENIFPEISKTVFNSMSNLQ